MAYLVGVRLASGRIQEMETIVSPIMREHNNLHLQLTPTEFVVYAAGEWVAFTMKYDGEGDQLLTTPYSETFGIGP